MIRYKDMKFSLISGIVVFAFLTAHLPVEVLAQADASDDFLSGQEQPSVSSEDNAARRKIDLSKRVTLDLRNMNVVDALKYIGLRSGMNIVTSKDVTGSVSFQVQDVPIGDILDITLLSNNLAYEKIGEIYYFMTAKEYQERYGKQFSDARKVKIFHLQYAIPQKAFDLLDTLKSSVGRILVDQESATVMLLDTPEKIAQMEKALETLEQKNQVIVFNLEYASAKDIQEQLKSRIDDKGLGSSKADDRTNQVVVQTLPDRMEDIERIIKALDKKTKEVLIDAKIIKIRLSDEMAKEFNWEGMFQNLTDGGLFLGSHPLSPVYRTGQTFIDDFTTIDPESNPSAGIKATLTDRIYLGKVSAERSYEVFFKFLQTLGDTKLISNPRLSVVNNQEAKIHIGRKEAYVTTTTTTGQTTSTTAEQVTFIDVGIQLGVTPTINDEGYITMKVKPEISSVVDTLETPSGNKIPIVDTSMAETTVMVKDNTTIVIGGLRREDETVSNKRVPGLSRIPVLGVFFSSKTTNKERSELLVMITPRIIEGNTLIKGEDNKAGDVKDYRNYETSDFQISDEDIPMVTEENHPLELKTYKDYNPSDPVVSEPSTNYLKFKSYRE